MLWLSNVRFCLASRNAAAGWHPLVVLAVACSCGRIGYASLGETSDAAVVAPSDATADASSPADTDGPLDSPAGLAEAAAEGGAMDSPLESGCASSADTDYCTELPFLPAPPVIDGVLDCGPSAVTLVPVDWSGPSPLPPFPAGNSATLAAAWRPDGLYVFVSVVTPVIVPADASSPLFFGSAVEIYVDSDGMFPAAPAYDNPGAIQLVAAAPPGGARVTQGEGYRDSTDQGPWASTLFGTFPTATGFVFEGFVVAADLGLANWALASALQIGFDVAVDVSYSTASMTGDQGHRLGQYFFHVGTPPINPPFEDVRSFCTPLLDAP
jgi:hypothetical protein